MVTSTKKRPVHEIRLGRIRAAIWENDTRNGTLHNVTFSRIYRDEEGNWQDSTSFGRDDLLLVGKVADRVHSWVCEQGRISAQESIGNGQGEEVPF